MATAAQIIAHVKVTGMPAFMSSMKQANSQVNKLGGTSKALSGAMGAMGGAARAGSMAMGVFGGAASVVTSLLAAAITAYTVAATAITAFAVAASHAAADIEKLQLGLKAVLGTTEAAGMEFKRLRDIARMPGLTLEDTVEGFLKLKSTGMGIEESEKALRAFGNALASVGGGKDRLKGVLLAVSQIATTEFMQGDELRQLAEHLPQIRQVLIQAFGTSSTEDLKKAGITSKQVLAAVVTGLEQIPSVAGGATNAMENFWDTFKLGNAAAGEAINAVLVPALNQVAQFIEFLTDSGFLKSFGESIASAGKMIVSAFGGEEGVLKFATMFLAIMEKIPGVLSNTFVAITSFVESAFKAILSVLNFIPDKINQIIDMVNHVSVIKLPKVPSVEQAFGNMFNNLLPQAFPTIFQPGMMDDIGKRADELANKFRIYQKVGPPAVPSIPDVTAASKQVTYYDKPIQDAMGAAKKTEKNTHRTANATEKIADLTRNTLGGGNLGAMGVTPVEFGRFRNRSAVNVRVEFRPGASFEEVMADVARDAILQDRRLSGAH